MNKLRRLGAVAIVTAVLAVSASAGIMDSPGVVTPPPPPPPSETTSTSTSSTITMILTILSLIRS